MEYSNLQSCGQTEPRLAPWWPEFQICNIMAIYCFYVLKRAKGHFSEEKNYSLSQKSGP